MKTLREMMDLVESAQGGVAEGSNGTYILNVMDEATGEHWAIEIQASSPDMAKERAQQQGYKVLRIKEKGVAEGEKYNKTPSGDYVNMHTGVRSSRPPQKKVRGQKTGAEWDAIEKAKKEKEQGVAEASEEAMAKIDRLTRD